MRLGRRAALLAAVALTASGCALFRHAPKPDPTAQAFLDAWGRGDVAAAANLTDDASTAQATLQSWKDDLAPTHAELTLHRVSTDGDTGGATYSAAWTIPGVPNPWRYDGQLSLVKRESAWAVHWESTDVHPRLEAGQKLSVTRTLPARAALLDAAGTPLFTPTPVVVVGIQPAKVRDLPSLAATLAGVLHVDAGDIVGDVKKAKPNDFVTVITLRRPDYNAVRARIHDLPGTVFREQTQLLGPTRQFAQPLLGRVGVATKDVLDKAGPNYRPGDELGLTGLQFALNDRLSGTPGVLIRAVDPSGKARATLANLPGKAGTPVKLTLDRDVQAAADAAVASQPTPSSIVAIRPSTGDLLAVAHNTAVNGLDIALTGHFPAGSTFKTITATALLSAGAAKAESMVDCPATVTIGKVFQNEDRFDLGRIRLREAFAHSCNTTFTALSKRLDDRALPETAAAYGIGTKWALPVDSFGGSLPTPRDDTEKAADAIGQGKVEVSPLAMALVAAEVAKGGPVTPSLVAGAAATPTDADTPPGPPAEVLPALRDMMRAVVTEGTATALASVPGPPVAGKTGTAEHGTDVPPKSHAWFIGYRGDLAFAVFVQDGQSSTRTAVPVAKAFLTGLRG